MIDRHRRIHMVGIGGIGMSGLAHIATAQGLAVSGCDAHVNGNVRRLQACGVSIEVGHDATHLSDDIGLVVYSAAIPSHHAELLAAKARGTPVMTRGEFLAELAQPCRVIAVAGSHGKTTTSAMAAQLLVHAGWDPTAMVGGMMRALGTNARYGRGRYFIAETDESDGSFLLLKPELALVTNIDREHLNYYQSFEQLIAAFQQFVDQMDPGGTLIRCNDDPLVRQLRSPARQITYGLDHDADVTACQLRFEGYRAVFRPMVRGRTLGAFEVHVPGRHNVLNALSVIALGLTLDLSLITIREALEAFRGTERRFQLFRRPDDIWLVEDYAHHPAEIQATLDADELSDRHRLVVFQPHRFSRTKVLEREFVTCFTRADGLIVTDIYAAFESPIPGISGKRLAGLIKDHGHPCVRYVAREELTSVIRCIAQPGDTIFFLGAGDVREVCHAMVNGSHPTERTAR